MTLTLKRPSHIFALESIVTQSDGFGERLQSLFQLLIDEFKSQTLKSARDVETSPITKQMTAVILSRLGIKVEFICSEHLAAILPFYSNQGHIFLPDMLRGAPNIREQTKVIDTFTKRKGSVNVEKARVSGIFSEYTHPFYLNIPALVQTHGFTAADLTAVTLHELGHAFNACYYADRTDETNQVLASIARHLTAKETGGIEYVYQELKKVKPSIEKEEVDKILNGPRVVAGSLWFKMVTEIVRSNMPDDTYNQTSFELKADNFASRFGYGKELVLALDKLLALSPEKNKSVFIFMHIVNAMLTVFLSSLVMVSLAAGLLFPLVVFTFYTFIYFTIFRVDFKNMTYDELKVRYLRIRQDIIDQLKSPRLKKETVKELLESLEVVDLSIKQTIKIQVLPQVISDFVFPSARRAKASINDQQLMEQLASNDLFIHAASFRTL